MGLLGNIFVTWVLLLWWGLWIGAAMGMGGPGASNSLRWIIQLLIMLSYPIWIFIWLILSGKSFWWTSPAYFLIGFLIIFAVLNADMIRYAYNLARGINNSGYSVANNNAYFNAKPILFADAGSFDTFTGDLGRSFYEYAWDNQYVYYRGRVVEGSRGGPLEALDDLGWSRDYVVSDDMVIFQDRILSDCTRSKLQFFHDITSSWARCGENIYYLGQKVEGADAPSFQQLNSVLGYDKDRLYAGAEEAKITVDASSFKMIGERYYRDEHRIYYVDANNIYEVRGADVTTFEVVDEESNNITSDAHDSHSRYRSGERIGTL